MTFNLYDQMDPEAKPGKIMKRTKKRQTVDSEKKSAKCEDSRDKSSSAVPFPENDSMTGQDLAEGTSPEAGTDGSGGDTNSETLSFNLALSLILNQKKKELLECPEVLQMLQRASRNP